MQRHCVEKHDKEQEFKFKVRQVFWEDTTLRQVTEAIDIRREGILIIKWNGGIQTSKDQQYSNKQNIFFNGKNR